MTPSPLTDIERRRAAKKDPSELEEGNFSAGCNGTVHKSSCKGKSGFANQHSSTHSLALDGLVFFRLW